MATGRTWSLALLLLLPCATAQAAPPVEPEPDAELDEAPPAVDPVLSRARELNLEAQQLVERGELEAALALWEKAYILQPTGPLRSKIAQAHLDAYANEPVPENKGHLLTAYGMIVENLAELDERRARLAAERKQLAADGGDEADIEDMDFQVESLDGVRDRTEAQLDDIDAQIRAIDAAIELEIAERTRKELEVETRAQLEQERREFEARLRHQRRIYFGTGGSMLGVGVAFLSVMAANLAVGETHDKTNAGYFTDPTITEAEYLKLDAKGKQANQTAWATGLVGGTLVASGATLMIVGGLRFSSHRAAEREAVELSAGPGGLTLRF